MFLIMSSVIYDQKHGHVLPILMGKIITDCREFTPRGGTRGGLEGI